MTNELHDGYRYNGEVVYESDYGAIRVDHRTTATTLIWCAPPLHRYDVDKDGNIALVCRCGRKPRSQMV